MWGFFVLLGALLGSHSAWAGSALEAAHEAQTRAWGQLYSQLRSKPNLSDQEVARLKEQISVPADHAVISTLQNSITSNLGSVKNLIRSPAPHHLKKQTAALEKIYDEFKKQPQDSTLESPKKDSPTRRVASEPVSSTSSGPAIDRSQQKVRVMNFESRKRR